MEKKSKYAVIDRTESFLQSLFSDLVTFCFLIFCIYISKGSTWWTFVTGLMFMVFGFGKIAAAFGMRQKKFTKKDDLIAWANGLDWHDNR